MTGLRRWGVYHAALCRWARASTGALRTFYFEYEARCAVRDYGAGWAAREISVAE